MPRIDFDRWQPSSDDPQKAQYIGQRTAQEVFQDLKYHLESIGLLPDEYFLMEKQWENGREIPTGADIFCTADYGANEGIYLDVYLKWHDDNGSYTQSFLTGKTLNDSGAALDRMHLIISDIMKAFHGDGGSYTRHMKSGGQTADISAILHLNPEEHRLLIDSLIQRRESRLEDITATEQLLRRATGGILEFVNEVGDRPLHISAFDMAVLAIQDGNLQAFQACHGQTAADKRGELLIQAAGRPGAAGRQMVIAMLTETMDFSNQHYLAACKSAVDTGDMRRITLLTSQAKKCVRDLEISLHGKVILHAYCDSVADGGKRHIAMELLNRSTPEQIAAVPPTLLYSAAIKNDHQMCFALVEKGIDANEYAKEIIHTLGTGQNDWIIEHMLKRGMRVDAHNYAALQTAIQGDKERIARLLLDNGMDFEGYQEWAKDRDQTTESRNLVQRLAAYTQQSIHPQTRAMEPEMEIGGM